MKDPYINKTRRAAQAPFDHPLGDIQAFFQLPQPERLDRVRHIKGAGHEIAALVTYALNALGPELQITDVELFELLCDYVSSPTFQDHYNSLQYFAGAAEDTDLYESAEDIEALWRLIPYLPEWMSYPLLELLPTQVGLMLGIPKTVLDQLSPEQLIKVFSRSDVALPYYRKAIFFSASQTRTVRQVVVTDKFNLSYGEFGQIIEAALSSARRSRVTSLNALEMLGILSHAEELSLVFYEAIADVLRLRLFNGIISEDLKVHAVDSLERLRQRIIRRAGRHYEFYIWELRLYRLAKLAVPWAGEAPAQRLPPALDFLTLFIRDGDTWRSFEAFSAEFRLRWPADDLNHYLPRIEEFGHDL